ncbi:MAG: phosphopantothenoylcysteine decarboxylase, partial [Anaerohalosphaeraceae bacterium]
MVHSRVTMAKKKLNILITAGGTRESIDPVRYI